MKKIIENRRILRIVSVFLVAVFVSTSMPLQAQAGEMGTYTVTLRAGMHGDFRLNQLEGTFESEKKVEFKVENGADFSVQSTAAIVEIAEEYQGSYFVLDTEKTFYYNGKDQEYVIEYGRLVNGVEYKV